MYNFMSIILTFVIIISKIPRHINFVKFVLSLNNINILQNNTEICVICVAVVKVPVSFTDTR